MDDLQVRAERMAASVFTGGPVDDFERAGRLQLVTLLEQGLLPGHRVLDLGCGALRGGYWLIHFLDRGCYFGIEPHQPMLEAGLRHILEPDLLDLKAPRFDHNSDFDAGVFEEQFDFMLARSIWTHASKRQIEQMLDTFVETAPDGKFLTSYLPARLGRKDYQGTEWVGRSHEGDDPGLVAHHRRWVRQACARRGLRVRELASRRMNSQRWLLLERR